MAARAPAVAYRRNIHDTREALAVYFQTTRLVDNLFTASTIIPGCGRDKMKAIWLIARGDIDRRGGMENPSEAAIALAIANGIAPNLPVLEPAPADEHVCSSIAMFMKRQCTRREYVHITEDDYTELTKAPVDQVPGGLWHGLGLPARLADLPSLDGLVLTAEAAKKLLQGLIDHESPTLRRGGQFLYTVAFVAMSKRGEITNRKLQSICQQLQEQFNSQIELEQSLVRYVYQQVGQLIPEEVLPQMFETWARDMQDLSMRLRVTLEQAAESGLTQYHTIRKAMLEFPNFDWAAVAGLLPQDFQNFNAAVTAVGADRYYGFKKDLGVAAATKFASLAWLARGLFVKKGGPEGVAVQQFRGWIGAPLHERKLQALIDAYDQSAGVEVERNVETATAVLATVRLNAQALAAEAARSHIPAEAPRVPPVIAEDHHVVRPGVGRGGGAGGGAGRGAPGPAPGE
uniref:Nucleoprotein n=1 Tax=Liman tick virus TaxID=2789420 RepID=A0A8A1FRH2_9VIRU|nr:nucleoprotein [Liman tick virus]